MEKGGGARGGVEWRRMVDDYRMKGALRILYGRVDFIGDDALAQHKVQRLNSGRRNIELSVEWSGAEK